LINQGLKFIIGGVRRIHGINPNRLVPFAIGAHIPPASVHASRFAHGKPVGQAKITFGGHGAGLLMVAADPGQFRDASERVVQMHGATTCDKKDVTNTMFNELLDDVIRETYHLPAEHFTSSSPKKG